MATSNPNTLRAAAAVSADAAAQWLSNGGPVEYDMGEAIYHLEQALKLARSAHLWAINDRIAAQS